VRNISNRYLGWRMTGKMTEKEEFRTLFLEEFYLRIPLLENKMKTVIFKKIGQFNEAVDINNTVVNCISDIESILLKQLNAQPNEVFNFKERKRKLTLFKNNRAYLDRYILEATKSFCRKKQDYWTHGRNKADLSKGETHNAKKIGRAARVHFSGNMDEVDNWIENIASTELFSELLDPETIENLNLLFKEIGLNDKKTKCLWDRFNGLTFVEMAEKDPSESATPDKYRKRFKRVLVDLEPYSDIFKEMLLGVYN